MFGFYFLLYLHLDVRWEVIGKGNKWLENYKNLLVWVSFFISICSFATLLAFLGLFSCAFFAAEWLGEPVVADTFHCETKMFVLCLNCVPVEHDFAVLLDYDCCHLADYQKFENVDSQGEDEEELDLLACLFVFKIQTILIWGENHGCKHLQHGALQISEALQLIAPSVRNHVGKHDGKRPPKAAEKHNQAANVSDHGQRALDVGQELEEGDEEADEQD